MFYLGSVRPKTGNHASYRKWKEVTRRSLGDSEKSHEVLSELVHGLGAYEEEKFSEAQVFRL